jgi:hypothetical protein
MPFIFIILTRVLFVASMVFIVGYVFGGFSKNATLTTISKVAVILAIVLFIANNILSFRMGRWNHRYRGAHGCVYDQKDTSRVQEGQWK